MSASSETFSSLCGLFTAWYLLARLRHIVTWAWAPYGQKHYMTILTFGLCVILSHYDVSAVHLAHVNIFSINFIWRIYTRQYDSYYMTIHSAGIAEWLASRTLSAAGPGSNPGGAKKFSDGTCKYSPCVKLLLCWNYAFACCFCLYQSMYQSINEICLDFSINSLNVN